MISPTSAEDQIMVALKLTLIHFTRNRNFSKCIVQCTAIRNMQPFSKQFTEGSHAISDNM